MLMNEDEIPTGRKAESEASLICLKMLVCPDKVTLLELSRLHEIMINEGVLEQDYVKTNQHNIVITG